MKQLVSTLPTDNEASDNTCLVDTRACCKGGSRRFNIREPDVTLRSRFTNAGLEEIRGLIKNETFVVVGIYEDGENTRGFGSRFVEESKPSDIGARYKSRLVTPNYGDDQAATITKKVLTVQRLA